MKQSNKLYHCSLVHLSPFLGTCLDHLSIFYVKSSAHLSNFDIQIPAHLSIVQFTLVYLSLVHLSTFMALYTTEA